MPVATTDPGATSFEVDLPSGADYLFRVIAVDGQIVETLEDKERKRREANKAEIDQNTREKLQAGDYWTGKEGGEPGDPAP